MENSQEYELYQRRRAFEALLTGNATARQMALLDLEPGRRHYALVQFSTGGTHSRLRDVLLEHFLKYPAYILLEWSAGEYLVIIRAVSGELEGWMDRCAEMIRAVRQEFPDIRWYAAMTGPVESPAALPGCYETLSRLWADRYRLGEDPLLTQERAGITGDEESLLQTVDMGKLDPARLREILEQADAAQVPALVAGLLEAQGEALESDSFCRFLALGTRFTVVRFVEERGWDRRDFIRSVGLELPGDGRIRGAALQTYMTRAIRSAIGCRDGGVTEHCREVLRRAAAYIAVNFSREGLCLEQVAAAVELSPNYLSALFRRELDCTFIEYVTRTRMAKARELLEQEDLRSGEVAKAVGYRDPRYFSSLFRKTQGMTPMEYRKSRRSAD